MKTKLLVFLFLAGSIIPNLLFAQPYIQQGPKLSGTGPICSGWSVSLTGYGNGALVGGIYDNGGTGAMLYYIRTNGVWAQYGSKIVPSVVFPNSSFGASVAISSDGLTAIGGAPGAASDPGGAFVFTRSGSVWTEQAYLIGNDGAPYIHQGQSVAISGDGMTAMEVGYSSDVPEPRGGAWIFTRNGNSWTQQGPKLVPDSGNSGNGALSYNGNTAIVSAWETIYSGDWFTRHVLRVYTRSNGVWTQQGPKLTTDYSSNHYVSRCVSLSRDGNTAAIGGADKAIYIFTRSGGVWTQEAKLIGTGAVGDAYQGSSVSIAGDGNKVIFGGLDDNGRIGAAWIFSRSGGVWTQTGEKLVGSGAIGPGYQGFSVAFSGDGTTAMVGGPYDNNYYGASWVFVAQSMWITSPSASETVLAGEPYDITWESTGVNSLLIEVSIDSGQTYQTIATNVQASEKRYTWTVEDDILSAKCKIKITNTDDPTKSAKSGLFRIKPYILTRFKPNGDYEAFDPTIHGWLFPNSKTVMWPQSWWNQFDYENGFDPNTAQHYPDDWYGVPIRARSTNFPDWPLFVRAFGIDPCYKNLSIPTYSPAAVLYWKTKKLRDFIGSCFGFSVSSLLAFDFPTAFKAYFPELGNFTNVSELQPSDYNRRVINQLYLYQYGTAAKLYDHQHEKATVSQTLQDLKTMFRSGIRNDHTLVLSKYGGGYGSHSVVPYALKKIPNSNLFHIFVYDSNCPYGNCEGGTAPIVIADSANNAWIYPPNGFGGGISGTGLYLDAPVNTFLNRPIMPLSATIEDLKSASLNGMETIEQSYIQIMNTTDASITITDFISDSIGIHDTVMFNTMADGSPIVPKTGTSELPIGYFLPSGNYSIRINSFPDSLVTLTVFDSSNIFNYWRSDATNFQSDQISYNNGLDVGNPDVQLKTMNLEAIVRVDSSERYFQVLNCATLQSDSLRIMTPDNSQLKFVNFGSQKTYDLKITLAGRIESGMFSHSSIIVPANSSHYIVPNWGDLQNQPVKIYQDIGNIGTISDTIVVENQYTGIGEQLTSEIPCEFKLEQNYPNPFNPATIINFSVPKISLVTIKVYDVLGNEVATLVNEEKIQGVYSVTFDASHLSSGVYFYKINSGNYSEVKKMAFIK